MPRLLAVPLSLALCAGLPREAQARSSPGAEESVRPEGPVADAEAQRAWEARPTHVRDR